eukprot:5118952-Alexandrium_andersonii.AAC.1
MACLNSAARNILGTPRLSKDLLGLFAALGSSRRSSGAPAGELAERERERESCLLYTSPSPRD